MLGGGWIHSDLRRLSRAFGTEQRISELLDPGARSWFLPCAILAKEDRQQRDHQADPRFQLQEKRTAAFPSFAPFILCSRSRWRAIRLLRIFLYGGQSVLVRWSEIEKSFRPSRLAAKTRERPSTGVSQSPLKSSHRLGHRFTVERMAIMTNSNALASTMNNSSPGAAPAAPRQAGPYLIRSNAAISRRNRCARYRGTAPDGTKFEILEKDYEGNWFLVSVFTVKNGGRR